MYTEKGGVWNLVEVFDFSRISCPLYVECIIFSCARVDIVSYTLLKSEATTLIPQPKKEEVSTWSRLISSILIWIPRSSLWRNFCRPCRHFQEGHSRECDQPASSAYPLPCVGRGNKSYARACKWCHPQWRQMSQSNDGYRRSRISFCPRSLRRFFDLARSRVLAYEVLSEM